MRHTILGSGTQLIWKCGRTVLRQPGLDGWEDAKIGQTSVTQVKEMCLDRSLLRLFAFQGYFPVFGMVFLIADDEDCGHDGGSSLASATCRDQVLQCHNCCPKSWFFYIDYDEVGFKFMGLDEEPSHSSHLRIGLLRYRKLGEQLSSWLSHACYLARSYQRFMFVTLCEFL